MNTTFSDSITRKKILLTLKKKGNMSVDSLSKEVNITPMGVRQHLLLMEKNGIVEYITEKHGVGRPGFLYRLTGAADDLFPKTYQEFALGMLSDLEGTDGKDKVAELFGRRKERIWAGLSGPLSEVTNLSDKLRILAESMNAEGGIVEIEESNDSFILRQFNCPISKIALRFGEACAQDLQLVREITGRNVIRQRCIRDGDQSCTYVIKKNPGGPPG